MTPIGYRLTEAADEDLQRILQESGTRFGSLQRRRYATLVEKAVTMLVANPDRPASRPRDELSPGVRSFHVALAARRKSAASHVIYYLHGFLGDGTEGVIVLRILDDAMDPTRHVEFDSE